MNRPPTASFDNPVPHSHLPASRPPATHHPPPPHPPPYDSTSPGRSGLPAEGSRRDYDHLPPVHGLQDRASHIHLPSVTTYIQHYHYYNFNGNCTVQQASSDGQPNMIQMVGSSVAQPRQHQPAPHVDIPPVPPPMHEPFSGSRHSVPRYGSYAAEPASSTDQEKRPATGTNTVYATLSTSHLPSIPGPSRLGGAPSSALGRHNPFFQSSRPGKPPTSAAESRPLHGGQSSVLPRLRGPLDSGGPISLAPLQSSAIPSIAPLHGEEGKLPSGRPTKRSRLSRGVGVPVTSHEAGRGTGLHGGGAGSESNCASVSEDPAMQAGRGAGGPAKGYGMERMVPATNSSSPSNGEYPVPGGRNDAYDRSSIGPGPRGPRNVDESQSNDWEAVVEMYTTGKGTEDGVALKMITKGDGRRVSDRKLLEKRRTIGKTYECLGAERFEAAIGYKWENGVRRKQKMYHVISRCRVVNAMRKAGEPVPPDFAKLTALIDERIAEKEALKEAGKSGAAAAAANASGGAAGGVGLRNGNGGYGVEGGGRMVGRGGEGGPGRDMVNSGQGGESGAEVRNGRGAMVTRAGGMGRLVGASGTGLGRNAGPPDVVGREDEIERGRLHERGRYG